MEKFKEFLLINAGLILVAAGIYLFKIPNKFATGGVTGIAIVIQNAIPVLSVGMLLIILNILFLAVGFLFLGFSFGAKTIYSTLALSAFVWLAEKVYPLEQSLTGDRMLELFFAILLPGVGSAILFNLNTSTGGTDIVARILNKKTKLHIGKTLLMVDVVVAVLATLVYGIKIGMYSIMGIIIKGFLIDMVLGGLNISKQVTIISTKPEEIKEYIINVLNRGATLYKAVGAVSDSEKTVISTIVNRKQEIRLKGYIKDIDSAAFITVTNAAEIVGKGFKGSDL